MTSARLARAIDGWSARASLMLYTFGAYVALPTLLALVSLDVMLRYFLDAPLQWGRDANGLLLLITLFSAFPYCWDRGQHIRMEMFYSRQRGALKRAADVVSALAGAVVFTVLAAGAAYFAVYMAMTGETAEELVVPLWPFMVFLGFCALVLALRLVSSPVPADTGPERVQWD